ncbi:MAG: hypothetical protein MK008_05685 [Bdellovibrionales bacterium]|nr:hypothetical protein [Bdellovibrionales bacterium]
MIKTVLLVLSFSVFAQAQSLDITSWTFLDRNNYAGDRAAEVCFRLSPAPESLTAIKIVSDYRTSRKGIYYAHIDSEGHACQVVASYTGHVMVQAPQVPDTPTAISKIEK